MKTAALTTAPKTTDSHTGNRRPFFAGPLLRKAQDEPVQARLAVGRPGDRWEREADRVAGHVVDTPAAAPGKAPSHSITPVNAPALRDDPAQARRRPETASPSEELDGLTQPKAESEEPAQLQSEDEPAQAKAEDEPAQAQGEDEPTQLAEEEPSLSQAEEPAQTASDPEAASPDEPAQMLATEPGGAAVADTARDQMDRARGRGDPLPITVRDKMQTRFGADFQGIRIHTDSAAVQLTQVLRAQAVTRGPDIFFNTGKFDPGSRTGQHLLAHELTHTLQQGAANPAARIGSLNAGHTGGQTGNTANPLQRAPDPDADADDSYQVRPEILAAIRLARGEAGKVNAKQHGPDGKRIGWQRLKDYFDTALGGPVLHESLIQRIIPTTGKDARADALPSWCGIFTWWAMKRAGIPIPDWKMGAVPLDAMQLRGPGELPRKGDIAIDVIPNNHFAMVTGLESAKDAAGKPKKLLRVATINGNTAGEDNQGGQVQEKWHELEHWTHFLDPVGKMAMPPAALVSTSRTPDPVEAVSAGGDSMAAPDLGPDPATDPAQAETDAAKAATLSELEAADVAPPAAEPDPEALPAADLTLPPAADAGPAEAVAEIAAVSLDGPSDQATGAYLNASPSAMAQAQPGFATAISTKISSEQQDLAQNPPELAAKTSGLDDIPNTPAPEVTLPAGEVGDGTTGTDPGPIPATPETKPPAFTGNAVREKALKDEESGSFWDAFTSFLKSFVTGIRTDDPGISTKAGAAPGVALSGDADATRMDTQRGDAATSVGAARDKQVTAFKDHPGQQNIQPRAVDESFAAAPAAEGPEPIEELPDTGMADYAAAPLPADVRDAADAKVAVGLNAALEGPRADVTAAATIRDTDQSAGIATAEADAAKINTEADNAQRKAVTDNRAKVAKLQGDGMTEAHGAVNDFNKTAATEQTAKRKGIAGHVKEEEVKAKTEITKGETQAETARLQGEKDAAAKKAALEEDQKKGSWWDRAKEAIKSVVNVITKAIDDIFTAVRSAVAGFIEAAKNAAIGLINKARNWVVTQINDFRDWAKKQVDTYLADTFPGLAKRINGAIDTVANAAVTVVNVVADAAIAGVTALADGLAKLLDKILSVYQTALKTVVRVAGAAATGDFAGALRAVIEGACDIAGVSPKPIFDFLDRAGKAVNSILKDPVGFISNLFRAIGAGMSGFFGNIRTHLISGVIGWLTGALQEVQLTGPFDFTLSGILKIVLQVLGLTYANIKAKVIKAYPPSGKAFDLVEKGVEIVQRLLNEGPTALLDDIRAQMSDLKDIVMGGIREWLIITAIKEGVVWLLALTNPASAIIKAVKLIFDLVMFLVERFQQIKDFVMTVYDAVAAVAAGNFTAVTKGVEDALAKSIPVLISLFASVLGLGNIAKQVKSIIGKVTKPINKVIDAVVKKIVAFAKKLLKGVKGAAGKAKQKAGDVVEKISTWWKERRKFKSADGGNHSIHYRGAAGKADLMVASNPQLISTFLAGKQKDANASPADKKVAGEAAAQYQVVLGHETELEKLRAAREKTSNKDKVAYRAATGAVNSEIRKFRNALDALSTILQRASFGDEDDALVRTHLAYTGAGDKNAEALPLTYLSGNTKGSGPSQDPPDWKHAVDLDTKPDGTSASTWVRGHLVNDNLHGPGESSNLVPITKDMNAEMEAKVEAPAKSAIKERGKLFFYRTAVTYWQESQPVGSFPQKLVVTWGTAKRKQGNPKEFEPDQPRSPVTITMKSKPPAVATSYKPSINGGSATHLKLAIAPHGPITGYFVADVLLKEFKDHGAYSNESNMQDRLYTNVKAQIVAALGSTAALDRRRHVQATYTAITKGDVGV